MAPLIEFLRTMATGVSTLVAIGAPLPSPALRPCGELRVVPTPVNGCPVVQQDGGLELIIHRPPDVPLKVFSQPPAVRVNGAVATAMSVGEGRWRVVAPGPTRGQVRVEVSVIRFRDWSKVMSLNGSGHVDWTLNGTGTNGVVSQWPYITWGSTQEPLQALLDGRPERDTEFGTGVEPGTHALGWRRPGTTAVVCSQTVSVAADEERAYVCDPKTGAVTPR